MKCELILRKLQKMVSEKCCVGTKRTQNHTKTMNNFKETIMEHIKNQHSLNPTQISALQDRLSHIVSQFHTPHHLPYAAMIQRALLELKQKGGATEKSISEFIKREYDDLPWAHCSLLKHHLGFLSEHGDINVNHRFRYSVCRAGSSLGSMKGGKKPHRKKWKWNFERKQAKRLKLAIVLRSQKEDEMGDQNLQVTGNAVIETEKCQTDGLETPKQDGTIDTLQLHFTDGGENDSCSGSKDMDIDHTPLLVLRDGLKNQVWLEQLQKPEDCQLKLHDPCYLHAMELQAWNPNEDARHELLSPEKPPDFEHTGVEVSDSQEVPIVNSHPLQTSKHIATEGNLHAAPTVSPLSPEKKEQHRNALPTPIAEKLEKSCLSQPLQQTQVKKQEKKKGRYLAGRQLDKMLEQREVLLALPHLRKGSRVLKDVSMQNERLSRQLRRWSGDLPDITGRRAKVSSFQRQSGAQTEHLSVSPYPSMDLQHDEGSNYQALFHSTQLLALTQQDEDMPLRIYKRRGRRPKAKTDMMVQDELPSANIQEKQSEELPNLLCCRIQQEKTSEAALAKEEFTVPKYKDSTDEVHQLEPSKQPRRRGRPPKLVVSKGEDVQPSTKHKPTLAINIRRSKRNVRVHV